MISFITLYHNRNCPKAAIKVYKKLFVKKGAPRGCKFK